jgi:hypothetical protein
MHRDAERAPRQGRRRQRRIGLGIDDFVHGRKIEAEPARDVAAPIVDHPHRDRGGHRSVVEQAEPTAAVPSHRGQHVVEPRSRRPLAPGVQRSRVLLDEDPHTVADALGRRRVDDLDPERQPCDRFGVSRWRVEVHGAPTVDWVVPLTTVTTSGWSGSSGASMRVTRAT